MTFDPMYMFLRKVSKTAQKATILKIVAKKVVFETFLQNGHSKMRKKVIFEHVPLIPLDRHPTCLW